MTNCAADGRHVYFGVWEDPSHKFRVDLLRGYVGFRETFEAKPLSRVVQVAVDGGAARVVWEERSWGSATSTPRPRGLTCSRSARRGRGTSWTTAYCNLYKVNLVDFDRLPPADGK